MFHNYLITALRNFTRHKLYSFINIAGLTVGFTCAIFIILFVRDELSYDKWIPGTENLYRLEQKYAMPGKYEQRLASAPFPMAQAMLDHLPEVTARTRIYRRQVTVTIGDHQFPEIADIVDPNVLDVIGLPLVAGKRASVLAQPDSVVLSETLARKYFGRENAVGKTILVSSLYCDFGDLGVNCQPRHRSLMVTGVLGDLPHNTQLIADLMFPNTSLANTMSNEVRTAWTTAGTYSYVRLAPNADPNAITAKFRSVIDRLVDPMLVANLHVPASQLIVPILVPFHGVHLTSDHYGGMKPGGSFVVIYVFSAIGILILMVACFNFTNLATARAMVRAREIGLRKVVGATRWQVAVQFLGESVLTALTALMLALALTEILTPTFDHLVGQPITLSYLKDWPMLLTITGIGLGTGLLSGAYPAFVLSSFRPAAVLKSGDAGRRGSSPVRTALVVLQFAISIGLGITALVMVSQLSFARGLDLGLRKDGILVIDANFPTSAAARSFADALKLNPGISQVAFSDDFPFSKNERNVDVRVPGNPTTEMFHNEPAGPSYIALYGIKLLAGRLLSEQRADDFFSSAKFRGIDRAPTNVLINLSGARRLGFSPVQALGKVFYMHNALVKIVGVVADANEKGPKAPMRDMIYFYWPNMPPSFVSVRLSGHYSAETLAFIDRTWHRYVPSIAIKRFFLSDSFEQQFQADEREGDIFDLFVSIAIFITCLGLFGLAAFSTERRTKEIGLRKTFGAKTKDIVLMLLWQFSIPVLVANLIAWPVAYYYLHGWLEGYAYRIALSPLYFLGAGAAALVIAWATVIVHAAHVARANPIHALRYE